MDEDLFAVFEDDTDTSNEKNIKPNSKTGGEKIE